MLENYDLYLNNLHRATVTRDIIRLFVEAGFPVAFCWVVKQDKQKVLLERPFAFVQLEDSTKRADALAALDGKDFLGRTLHIALYKPSSQKTAEPRAVVASVVSEKSQGWAEYIAGSTEA
jgi:hypothetical protein